MFNQRTPLPEPKSKVISIILGLALLFFLVILPLLQFFVSVDNPRASSPYYDDSAELKAQDSKAQQYVEDEERKQKQREQQDAYDDYLLWLRETGGQ